MPFRQARLAAGESVPVQAKRLNVSPSTLRRWEAGGKASIRSLAKIITSFPVKTQIMIVEETLKGRTSPVLLQTGEKLLELLQKRMTTEKTARPPSQWFAYKHSM